MKVYSGKDTVYIDLNVLDTICKSDSANLMLQALGSPQIVFSDEILYEAHLSKNPYKFINTLTDLEAALIETENNQHLIYRNPQTKTIYEKRKEQYEIRNLISMHNEIIAFANSNNNIEDLKSALLHTKNEIIQSVIDALEGQGAVKEKYLEHIKQSIEDSHSHLQDSLFHEGSLLTFPSPVKKIRETLNINPKSINNTKHPILENIIINIKKPNKNEWIEIEKQLLEKTTEEKIKFLYHLLNVIGFFEDSGLSTTSRVRAAESDAMHLAMASHHAFFFTGDKRLIKKANVIYDYLGVKTKIIHLQTIIEQRNN